MIEINKKYETIITNYTSEGNGICRIKDFVVFVPNTVKDEKVIIKIVSIKKNYAIGKLIKVLEKSENRIKSECKYSKYCGGCVYQHINYNEEIKIKEQRIIDAYKKIANKDIKVEEIITSNISNYRNKITYKTKTINNILEFGYYEDNTNNFIPIDTCILNNDFSDKVTKELIDLLNKQEDKKEIKEIVLRYSNYKDQIIIAINSNKKIKDTFIKEITKKYPNIVGIINEVKNKENIMYGNSYLEEKIGDLIYNINYNSFYQVNSYLIQKLYETATSIIKLNNNDIVLDAYCGSGTISLYIANKVKKVYGIEINKSAIEDANKNKELNKINNAEFILGDVTEKINEIKNQIDTIIVDPPRSGLDNKFINTIINKKIKNIIYISCDVSTQARDIKTLIDSGYQLKTIKAVDMFPRTKHIECIALLQR